MTGAKHHDPLESARLHQKALAEFDAERMKRGGRLREVFARPHGAVEPPIGAQ